VCALSQLSAWEEVEEAEINPLIVKADGEGIVAVDGLIVLKR
jgi:succinyl-CoA synthetase beta subunit